jgi:monofunctional biosynthetic peptidoglycan transglycosylase
MEWSLWSQAASEYWYRKDAADLTPIQAAELLRPNPRKFTATSSSSY